jgi:hypothetical protein
MMCSLQDDPGWVIPPGYLHIRPGVFQVPALPEETPRDHKVLQDKAEGR